jgi:Fe2+ or Zn2+ uptake regulation protein
MTAQDLANKLWRLLPEVSDKDTIYQAVEFLQDLDKD